MRNLLKFQRFFVSTLILIQASRWKCIEALPSSIIFTDKEFIKSNLSDHSGTRKANSTSKQIENQSEFKYECQKGKIYKILLDEDLTKYNEEVECIFNAGLTPTKVPSGPLHGKVISIGNLKIYNPVVSSVWTGKFTSEVKCNGSVIHLGWNKIVNDAHFPFVGSIGQHSQKVHLHPQEYVDGKESFLIDYLQDFYTICPDYKTFIDENKNKVTVKRTPWNKSFFPLNQIVDVTRVVGRQEDGGLIFLGKMYYRDIFQSDIQASVYAYFSMVSYDHEVNPEFKIGQHLPPIISSFKFRVPTSKDIILGLIPFDNVFQIHPVKLLKRTVMQTAMSSRNFGNFVLDLVLGLGSSDSRKLGLQFQYSVPGAAPLNESELSNSLNALAHHKFSHPHTSEL